MSRKLQPLNDRILLEPVEEEKKSASGLILTKSANPDMSIGKVVAVGNGAVTSSGVRVESQLSVGDEVMYTSSAGRKVVYEGKEYILVKEQDTLLTLK